MAMQIKDFFPELNYWTHVLIRKCSINDKNTHLPCHIENERWKESNSVISLLLDETYNAEDYEYLYYPADLASIKHEDDLIARRLQIYGPYVKPYILFIENNLSLFYNFPTDMEELVGENYFQITDEELVFLDILLDFRLLNSPTLQGIDYSNLESPLSRLIYIYLDFKLNGSLAHYSTQSYVASPNNLLHCLFEKFVINAIYVDLSHSYFKDILVESERSLHPTENTENRIFITEEQILNREIIMDVDKTAINEADIYMVKDGKKLVPGKDFIYTMIDSTTGIVDAEGINTFKKQGKIEIAPHVDIAVGDQLVVSWPYQTLQTPFQEMN